MNKVIFFILLSFTVIFKSYSQISEFDLQNSIYKKAKSYNDPSVAINSLYKMIAIQPENVLLNCSTIFLSIDGLVSINLSNSSFDILSI